MLGLGATFTDSIVLGETQTINGGDTATVVIDGQTNSTVGVFVEEEQSANSEMNHTNETIGIVAFENGLVPCFTQGTQIATPRGLVPVERLSVGDLVETVDNGVQEIRWIGRRRLTAGELNTVPELRPVRLLAGALGQQLPKRDLLFSRQHRVLVSSKIAERMFGAREVLVAAIKLTALPGIFVDTAVQDVEYIHLLFDNHELLFAEGAQAESLYLGTEATRALSAAGRSEIAKVFPELALQNPCQKSARFIPPGSSQKQLMVRHKKNNKAALM